MKLICLNVWGGKKFEALKNFIGKMSPETDVFCFQEVYDAEGPRRGGVNVRTDLFRELKNLLPDFDSSFAPVVLERTPGGTDKPDISMGNAIFHKKALSPKKGGELFTVGSLRERENDEPHKVGVLQHITLGVGEKRLTVCNFHGVATWPKSDTPERLGQSKKILEFLSGIRGPVILCGDFNLFPDTKSIAVLGHAMKNLMEEFKIETTRSRIFYENFKGEAVLDSVSDYMFVSPGVNVGSLQVSDVEVSDHLPLVLDFLL